MIVNAGDKTDDVTVFWNDTAERWHNWTGPYGCLHVFHSVLHPLVKCVVVTCKSALRLIVGEWLRHIPREPHVWKVTDTVCRHIRVMMLSEKQGNLASRWPADTWPYRSQTHRGRVYCVGIWVRATVLLNNTSLTCQSYDFKVSTHWETKEGGGWAGGGGLVWIGVLSGETKTKIWDEQWWEGQRRSEGWLIVIDI